MSTVKKSKKPKTKVKRPGSASRATKAKKTRKGFVPRKGGDGGKAVPVVRGPHWNDNGKVVLTGSSISGKKDRSAFLAICVQTADVHDRAHRRRRLIRAEYNPHHDDSWTLTPWGELAIPNRSLPGQVRRYHPSQMVGTRDRLVGFDSMFDDAAHTAGVLEAAGIEMGWHTTRPGQMSRGEADRRSVFLGMNRDEVRNRLEQVTTQQAITRDDIDE